MSVISLEGLALEAKAMDIVDFNSLVGVALVAETKGTVEVDMTVDVDENVEQPLVDNVSCLLVLALVAVLVAVVVEVLTVVDVVWFHVLAVEIVYSEVAVVAPPSVDCHCRPFGSAMSSHPSLDVVQMLQEMRIQQRHKCTHACTESKTTFMLKCIKKRMLTEYKHRPICLWCLAQVQSIAEDTKLKQAGSQLQQHKHRQDGRRGLRAYECLTYSAL